MPVKACRSRFAVGRPFRNRLRPGLVGPDHHAAGNADTDDVHPALVEVEQVGVEQRGEDVLNHDQKADPVCEPVAAKQQQMHEPQCIEHDDPDAAPLYSHVQGLVVRIVDDNTGGEILCADRRALEEFDRLRGRLKAELGLAPSVEVVTLASSIAGRVAVGAESAQTALSTSSVAAAVPSTPTIAPVPRVMQEPLPAVAEASTPKERRRRRRWIVAAAVVLPLMMLAGFLLDGARRSDPAVAPDVVVVLPFSVHGDREAAYLSAGLVDLLATNLDGAGRLRAVQKKSNPRHGQS